MIAKIVNEIKVYEINGKDTEIPFETRLYVESHWTSSCKFVVLNFKDMSITVAANDLLEAIKNATNKSY